MITNTRQLLLMINNFNTKRIIQAERLVAEEGISFEQAIYRLPEIDVLTNGIKDFCTASDMQIAINYVQSRVDMYRVQGFDFFSFEKVTQFQTR